jgi:hypothetical protein
MALKNDLPASFSSSRFEIIEAWEIALFDGPQD